MGKENPRELSAAWDEVVCRYDHTVFLSLLARGLTPDRARDVAQMTWLRLIEKHRDVTKLCFPGVAVVQARFLALDLIRQEQRTLKIVEPYGDTVPDAADGLDVESRVMRRGQLDRAVKEISRMHRTAQHVFRLTYGGTGYSTKEVAIKVGISEQRVRQIHSEIRQRIRPILQETDP